MNFTDINYFKMAVGTDRIKHETLSDISARCPICGDSKYSKNKARLHLYERNGVTLVNCFNDCAVHNMSMFRFLKTYYPNLFPLYKNEVNESKIKSLKKDLTEYDLLGDFKSLEVKDKPPVTFNLSKYFKTSDKIENYLESRGLEHFPIFGDFYLGSNITIDNKNFPINNYIIIPLYYYNEWYGFYSRSLTEHRFYTYIPDKNQGYKLWNYYNLDKSKTIYIFEGIFDAMSAYSSGIENVCACMGATPPLDLIKDLDVVFCLDNDQTGIKNSIKFVKQGFKTVIYPTDLKFKDCNEMLQNNIDLKSLILNNIYSGCLAEVKLRVKL